MIVRDSAGQLFFVNETGNPNLAHVWNGIPAKKVKGGYAVKGIGTIRMIRKAGCTVVKEG
jgi:hypothetical protein